MDEPPRAEFFDPFAQEGFDLEARTRERAGRCGIELDDAVTTALARHARAVLRENDELHLTSITDPGEFLERHIGEAFEGAAMLAEDVTGLLLDVGSGNGYPALPFAVARSGVAVVLAEASTRKAAFLRATIADAAFPGARVFEAQVQRAADVEELGAARLITSRAMGGWAKILPRLVPALAEDGELLVWAGEEMEAVARRAVWRKLRLEDRRPLPQREQSWIWRFRRA